ncbi:MAG: hypothetical protein Phog2KO_14210 [Phototrophicaceae bacterium]
MKYMLKKLDDINWDELNERPNRSATNVPNYIKGLLSPSEKIRNDSIISLRNSICFAFGFNTATLATIPFLVELLKMESVQDKHRILDLVRDCYVYYDQNTLDRAKLKPWRNNIRMKITQAILDRMVVYFQLLNHDDWKVRLAVIEFIAIPNFPQNKRKQIEEHYQEFKSKETHPEIQKMFMKIDEYKTIYAPLETVTKSERRNMLEKLEEINWSELRESFGHPATDVPNHIRGLLSPSKKIRWNSMTSLSYSICNEHILGTATLATIPFLVEILRDENIQDKHNILYLIHDCYSDYDKNIIDNITKQPMRKQLKIKITKAILDGMDIYLYLLNHDDWKVRLAVIDFIGRSIFPQHMRKQIEKHYQEFKSKETHPEIQEMFMKIDKHRATYFPLENSHVEDEN